MKIRNRYFLSSCVALLLSPALLSTPAFAQPTANRVVSDDVTKPVLERLLRIVGAQPQIRAVEGKRVVFVGAEALHDKDASITGRLFYRTIHYRYADDVTVFTTVDLERGVIVNTREAKHVPTPITAGELAEATRIALADGQVRQALGSNLEGAQTEALGLYSEDRNDSIYGHRALNLVFHHGDLYVANIEVVVDLTAGRVTVTRRGNENHH